MYLNVLKGHRAIGPGIPSSPFRQSTGAQYEPWASLLPLCILQRGTLVGAHCTVAEASGGTDVCL